MFQQNLQAICKHLEAIRKESFVGLKVPAAPKIIAISKTQSDDAINAALQAGQRLFGENRVQEAQQHWATLRADYADLELHLVGPLQTNKAKDAVALFDVIQSIDRISLVDALLPELQKQGKQNMKLFIQVNTGNEPQKSGVSLHELPALIAYMQERQLSLVGLMCIPPVDEPAGLHFALLRKLAKRHNLPETSMGMSGDYKYAAALGASYLRIGTALFGERS